MDLEQKEIESRSVELLLLSRELSDLQGLMYEFNNLIHQQEIYIDNVEENINHSREQTEQSVPELVKAEIIQFNGRRKAARFLAATGGGIVGTIGFLLNPIVGFGTTIGMGYGCWVKSRDIRRN